jgi:hypothetical protein
MRTAKQGDHFKLAFNISDTWSQKYNLVWDMIRGYSLLSPSVPKAEMTYYVGKMNQFDLPLDSRTDYTRLNWSHWAATLAPSRTRFATMVDPIHKWTNESRAGCRLRIGTTLPMENSKDPRLAVSWWAYSLGHFLTKNSSRSGVQLNRSGFRSYKASQALTLRGDLM